MKKPGQTVYVGISGGVDSATSAALLQEQGFDVVGAFIKIWQPEFIECTWSADRLDAMRSAAALGIPFREIDLSHEYKRDVIENMLKDYAAGITPNPDIMCNAHIKFGAFMKWALQEGADMVATGHYARIESVQNRLELMRGRDHDKDQSYFVHRISGLDLPKILFPIGGLLKSEVRERSHAFNLPVADKPDSQGLCFVGDVSMRDFLQRFISVQAGDVIDKNGKRIGTHAGAPLYTIGERRGFNIDGNEAQEGTHYITAVDVFSNTLTVSRDRHDTERTAVTVQDLHWLYPSDELPETALAQVRYRESPTEALLRHTDNKFHVTLQEPRTISGGQSIVFYENDRVLGGGIIEKS